jgi:stage II sporulation SpoM-like protein
VKVSQLALVQGMDDTRAALRRWNAAPMAAVRPWALGATAISIGLLAAVWLISRAATPDPMRYLLPGLDTPGSLHAIGRVLFRNSLVLALHSTACIAGFIAGSSLPLQAEHHHGWWRTVHEKAGPAAIAFVAAATAFSLCTQAYVLGSGASTLATQLEISRAMLILTLLPHALPELFALFLPLAAWMIASRRSAWEDLLAATAATTAMAVPILIVAANVEVFVWPHLLRLASPVV